PRTGRRTATTTGRCGSTPAPRTARRTALPRTVRAVATAARHAATTRAARLVARAARRTAAAPRTARPAAAAPPAPTVITLPGGARRTDRTGPMGATNGRRLPRCVADQSLVHRKRYADA